MLLLLACGGGSVDPRTEIAERFAPSKEATPAPEAITSALSAERLPVACHLAKVRAARETDDQTWLLLLTAAARTDGCLSVENGDNLAIWASTLLDGRAPRAEWLASRGRIEEALAALGAQDDPSRMRIALRAGDGDAARLAADGALLVDPRDVAACRLLANVALEERDYAWAVELSACGSDDVPELRRIRAAALDGAGLYDEAADLYGSAGADVHRAAILYQEHPERSEEALALLKGPTGPAALHRTWLSLCLGRPAPTDGLDQSVQATVARALVASDAPPDALADVPGPAAAVARARLAAERRDLSSMERELDAALRQSPASDPIHRARIALRLSTGGDVDRALADWAALDPDHVALSGARGDRDLPWCGIVPETWAALASKLGDPRASADAPRGTSTIGDRIRAARAHPTAGARSDALTEIDGAVPGLDALPAERYRLGPPPMRTGPDRSP